MQRILVVETDYGSAKLLRSALTGEGYTVTTTDDPAGVLELLATEQFDLLTLDTDLRCTDGLDLCRTIRLHSTIPIIFVATRGGVAARVAGLRAGADDYLVKPFEPAELLARIWAVRRRMGELASSEALLRTPDFVLDPLSARVTLVRTGQWVELTPHELRLLRFLMRNPGRTLTREALMIKGWGYYEPDGKQLAVYMWRLRNKLEPDPSARRLIVTVRGVGYKYVPSSLAEGQSTEEG